MSYLTYTGVAVSPTDKVLVVLHGAIKTPPFGRGARIEAGYLLRRLQRGEQLSMPQSRSMPGIGKRCHELRVQDSNVTWRIVYRLDSDAVIIGEIFEKKTSNTPKRVIDICRKRFKEYDLACSEEEEA
jgi:phage-related protein